jgi:hypothetical protein
VGGPIALAVLLVLASVLMTGPAPEPADQGLPKDPPPLALPADVADDGAVATAAAQLAAGDLDEARAGFTDAVADDHDDVVAQAGLILSRWRTTGPVSVERDLGQLAKEYPESAFVALHLGLVQTLLDEPRAARASLRDAVELGRSAADETSLRMARLADDLLHPDAYHGELPVLVAPDEVPTGERAALRALLGAVGAGDRDRAVELAGAVGHGSSALLRVAALAAAFDKDAPDATVDRLDAVADDEREPVAARDRARLLSALALAWGGGSRAQACVSLRASAKGDVDAGTRRLAGPISKEICG